MLPPPSPERISCGPCEPGQYANTAAQVCVTCPRGTYAPLPQENECIQCQGGSFTEIETAATTCSQCQVGRVSTNTEGENSGPEGCKACDPGKYQMAVGQTACIDCPENEYAAEEASFLCRDCETDFGPGVGSRRGSSKCGICKPFFFMNVQVSRG